MPVRHNVKDMSTAAHVKKIPICNERQPVTICCFVIFFLFIKAYPKLICGVVINASSGFPDAKYSTRIFSALSLKNRVQLPVGCTGQKDSQHNRKRTASDSPAPSGKAFSRENRRNFRTENICQLNRNRFHPVLRNVRLACYVHPP